MAGDIGIRVWRELAAAFKTYHHELGSVCWLCRQPINYDAPGYHPDSFEPDHGPDPCLVDI